MVSTYIREKKTVFTQCIVQLNLNSSNTDGSFTISNSNSFLSPYEILPIAQENEYLGKFSFSNFSSFPQYYLLLDFPVKTGSSF